MPHVYIDARTHQRIRQFAAIDGSDVEATVRYALNDFMDNTGDCLLEFLAHEAAKAAKKAAKAERRAGAKAGVEAMDVAQPSECSTRPKACVLQMTAQSRDWL